MSHRGAVPRADHRRGVTGTRGASYGRPWPTLLIIAFMVLPWTLHAAGPPVLTGAWVLEGTVADAPRARLREVLESRPPGRERLGGPPIGARAADGAAAAVPGMPRTIAERLDIIHHDPAIRITPAGGREERLYTDYRGASVSAKGDSQVVATAGWEGDTLVVESHLRGGVQVLRRYRLDPQADELDFTVEFKGRWWSEPVSIPVTYRRAPAGAVAEPES